MSSQSTQDLEDDIDVSKPWPSSMLDVFYPFAETDFFLGVASSHQLFKPSKRCCIVTHAGKRLSHAAARLPPRLTLRPQLVKFESQVQQLRASRLTELVTFRFLFLPLLLFCSWLH
jgi:hypothetical protein